MESFRDILDDENRLMELTKNIFDAIDLDHNNYIDKKELKKAMNSITRESGLPPPTDEKVNQTFIALDADGNGKIDVKEFKSLIRQLLEVISS